MNGRLTKMAMLVRILCAVAMLSIGFAHRPVAAEPVSPELQFAAYALPDGTLPVFCITDTGTSGEKGKHEGKADCEACRLGASMLLAHPPAVSPERLASVALAHSPLIAPLVLERPFEPNTAPRAPPLA